MFSKTKIETAIDSEDGTAKTSLGNATTILYGGGYECDGVRVIFDSRMKPEWTVIAHFTHNQYNDVIEHRFNGFNLNTHAGQKALAEMFDMFNVHPHFNPYQPRERYAWGYYAKFEKPEAPRG